MSIRLILSFWLNNNLVKIISYEKLFGRFDPNKSFPKQVVLKHAPHYEVGLRGILVKMNKKNMNVEITNFAKESV